MSVVPVDDVSGAIGLREVDSRNVEVSIANTPGGENHHVIESVKILKGEVGAEVNVANKPRCFTLQHFMQGNHDLLNTRVVRSHAVAHQTERSGKAFQ